MTAPAKVAWRPWLTVALLWCIACLNYIDRNMITTMRQSIVDGANPRDVKMMLGVELVTRFHGLGSGEAARVEFIAQFSQGQLPENIPEIVLAVPEQGMSLAAVLKEAGLVASNGEGNRMIDQKAVKIDQQRVEDRGTMLKAGGEHLLQVGPRRYARVSLKPL